MIWGSLGDGSGGASFLRSQETNEPVSPAKAPYFICQSLVSCVAFGHTLLCLKSKQAHSHHTGQAKADGNEETRICVASLLLLFLPTVTG